MDTRKTDERDRHGVVSRVKREREADATNAMKQRERETDLCCMTRWRKSVCGEGEAERSHVDEVMYIRGRNEGKKRARFLMERADCESFF